MSRHGITSAILLTLVLFSSAGCAAIHGERVETGMAESRETDFSPDTTPLGSLTATANLEADMVVAGRQPVSVDNVLQVRPVSELSPEWTTKPEAFDFLAPELFSGAPVSGTDLYATGPVLMTFVSPSCVVSTDDGPALADVAERNPMVTFVFVHTDGDTGSYEQFVENADLYQENAIHINDSDLMLWNRFGIQTQPSTVLVDGEGRASMTGGGLGPEGLAIAVGLLGAAN